MQIQINNVRSSWLHVVEPAKTSKKYEATFLIDMDSQAQQTIESAIAEKLKKDWGSNWSNLWSATQNNKKFYRKGDTNVDSETGITRANYVGKMYFVAKNTVPPVVFAPDGKTLLSAGEFKPGDFFNVIIDIYTGNKEGKGIFAELCGLQFVCANKGMSRGGDKPPVVFAPIADDTATNPFGI